VGKIKEIREINEFFDEQKNKFKCGDMIDVTSKITYSIIKNSKDGKKLELKITLHDIYHKGYTIKKDITEIRGILVDI